MNINYDTKPKITFSLDPLHQAYCRHLFNSEPGSKYIIVSRRSIVGKLIHSFIFPSNFPVNRPLIENPVTFVLPVKNTNHYIYKSRFIYIPKWAEEKLQDYIEADFKCWVRERFEIGYKKKFDQKEIIEAILRGLNVRNNTANYDTIKKIDYRYRRKKTEKRFSELLSD
ncbi:hypothetical protein [Draconibacterium sp.]|uniref:hypothetical protein n=1 Tax=Draconibacterium sp. TaxID=1965318 RepID=UPI00356332F1